MNEALEERAALQLLSELSHVRREGRLRRRAGLTEADPDDGLRRRRASFEARVEALAVVGALELAYAAHWRGRFEAVASEPVEEKPAPDGVTRERVERFLTELYSEKKEQTAASVEDRVRSFVRTVWALEAVGAIPMAEASTWVERMQQEQGVPTHAEQERAERARTCSALDLRRVVAAPMMVGGLRISHLELYADGALLYGVEHARGSIGCGTDPRSVAPHSDRGDVPLEVVDDLGTVYEARPFHGFAKSLTPAIPDAASQLNVIYAGMAGKVALR